ncbi:hypothetical protein [Phenylobacterium sp.]|jgi:hypothetical protein|nr:hypothetical protein [Phenylobacterium sp.]HEX3365704.1 hypothetical protein [Phenylobacterium sp.]
MLQDQEASDLRFVSAGSAKAETNGGPQGVDELDPPIGLFE